MTTYVYVTPYAGVWIEILSEWDFNGILNGSLPTRECGLKFCCRQYLPLYLASLPTRECGLKYLYA